jgi:hypothetical protein
MIFTSGSDEALTWATAKERLNGFGATSASLTIHHIISPHQVEKHRPCRNQASKPRHNKNKRAKPAFFNRSIISSSSSSSSGKIYNRCSFLLKKRKGFHRTLTLSLVLVSSSISVDSDSDAAGLAFGLMAWFAGGGWC